MRWRISIGLLACSITPWLCAQDGADRSVHSKIIAMERTFKVLAYQTKDTKTMSVILDDSFVGVDEHGSVQTKAELLRSIQTADALHYTVDAMIVKVHGETAIVTGLYQCTGTIQGKPFQHRGRFVDTWLQKHGQWVVIASLSILEP